MIDDNYSDNYEACNDLNRMVQQEIIINRKNKQLDSFGLTVKEREVAELLLKGLTCKEIANTLGNTEKTMKHHLSSIYKKAKVESRPKLLASIFGL